MKEIIKWFTDNGLQLAELGISALALYLSHRSTKKTIKLLSKIFEKEKDEDKDNK